MENRKKRQLKIKMNTGSVIRGFLSRSLPYVELDFWKKQRGGGKKDTP